MANVTWKASSGEWADELDWVGLVTPQQSDIAVFNSGNGGTATIAAPASISGVRLSDGTATLVVASTLTLAGTIYVDDGTLDLPAGGVIAGGTVQLGSGSVTATGGTLEGVLVVGTLANGLAIDAATASLSAAATAGTLTVSNTLGLVAGTYSAVRITNVIHAAPSDLVIGAGSVTIDTTSSIVLSLTDPLHELGQYPTVSRVSVTGPGTLVNAGLIYSDISAAGPALDLASAAFINDGSLEFAPVFVPEQQQFAYSVGKQLQPILLSWTETLASEADIGGGSFINNGTVTGVATILNLDAAEVVNVGDIVLSDGTTQAPLVLPGYASVVTTQLESYLAINTDRFFNTGIIAADTIEFDGYVTLGELGTLDGAVLIAGTLNLEGGTLDIGADPSARTYAFTGSVENGVIITDGAVLNDATAVLSDLTVLPGALTDITTGSVTLAANATTLTYTTAATISGVSITAGAAGTIDQVVASAAGILTFAASTTITDDIPNSTLDIDGPGTFYDAGKIAIDAATLVVATTLDGNGTIDLAGGAALTIDNLAASATTTVAFGAGRNLLTLPGNASGLGALGLALTGLQMGDVLDFSGVSANAPVGTFGFGGAAPNNGTLDVQGASGQQATVLIPGAANGLTFKVSSDPGSGTLVTVACFRAATAIATPNGEVAVESLRLGDHVLTADRASRPIKWIGRRAYSAQMVADQPQLRAVRIAAGALDNAALGHPGALNSARRPKPYRDLFVSPLHGLFIDGMLIPAVALVNGTTITRADAVATAYFHIELATPDLILAEGAIAETFCDCQSRGRSIIMPSMLHCTLANSHRPPATSRPGSNRAGDCKPSATASHGSRQPVRASAGFAATSIGRVTG